MKILYFGDPIGCGDDDFKAEAKLAKDYFEAVIFKSKKFEFEATVDSMKPVETQYDILAFDFGGIGLGCSGLVTSLSREILKLIEERPNTLFIAWTTFTNEYLKGECEKELGDYKNLMLYDEEEKIKDWIKRG